MTSNPTDLRRRKFLLTAGASGAGAVAAVVTVTTGTGLLQAEATTPTLTPPASDGAYQATEHVRNYYRTARV